MVPDAVVLSNSQLVKELRHLLNELGDRVANYRDLGADDEQALDEGIAFVAKVDRVLLDGSRAIGSASYELVQAAIAA